MIGADIRKYPALKGRFPFKLGTSSYIIQDDILPNVRFLKEKVDDVEIILFEYNNTDNIPSSETLRELSCIADENNLSYTIHMPLDLCLGSGNEKLRMESVEKSVRIIDIMRTLHPFSFVFHFNGDNRGSKPSLDIERWLYQHRRSLEQILKYVEPSKIAVETLEYPFEIIYDTISSLGLKICMDIGHIILCEYDLQWYIGKYLPETQVIHLHGVNKSIDHKDITFLDEKTIAYVLTSIKESKTRIVLTIEVFSEEELYDSMKVMEKIAL